MTGTKEEPWQLRTAPQTSAYMMWADDSLEEPTLFCQVGSTQLRYRLRAIDDLHAWLLAQGDWVDLDRKSTRLNSSHPSISYAVFCLKKKKTNITNSRHL